MLGRVQPQRLVTLPRRNAVQRRVVIRAVTTVPSEYKTVAPVGDRVLVKVDVSEEKSMGGILLPASVQKKPTQGKVEKAGTAKAVRDGEKVVYSKYAGTELKVSGTEYVILKEDDVIGILSTDNIADLKPLGDRLLVEVDEAKDETDSGLLLTSASKEQPTIGKVVAVGSGKEDDKGVIVKPNLNKGDTVLYSKYSGTEFAQDDKQYIVIREMDVLASVQ
ncbi:g5978 [Coccomyxa viridis]|uniref:G5978 protein n=1 Tax=Coccomyxa viridis TaxID=1274662 RepID=A0ABP1FWV0_9CHLO